MKKLEINTLLVPVDFSENAINAYSTALTLANNKNAHVVLLFVFDTDNNLYPESPINNRYHYPGDNIRSLEELAVTARNEYDISCDIAYTNGGITHCILQKAIEINADLIIMGKNGHSGNRSMYAGSHTYDVIKKSHCPVLMVAGPPMHEPFSKILFPVRPVLSMLEKYNTVRPILSSNNASLHLMAMRDPAEIKEVHIISKLMTLLKQHADDDGLDIKMTYHFENNDFAQQVITASKSTKDNFNLVVITAELDNTVREFYLGDYAQQIIHQANIPVLVIRATTEPLPKEKVMQILQNETAIF